MTMVFMSLIAAMIAERISVRAGLRLLPVLLVIGAASVVQLGIFRSELQGAGTLRFYGVVQLYAGLVLVLMLFLPARYTRTSDGAAGWYLLAKLLETFDKPIFALGHIVSGHTLKHLAAGTAGWWILRDGQAERTHGRYPDSPSEQLTLPGPCGVGWGSS